MTEQTEPVHLYQASSVAPDKQYNRDLLEYEINLMLKFEPGDYVGKRILDIGAGEYDTFGREARRLGIDVVSINPALGPGSENNNEHRTNLLKAVKMEQRQRESDARDEFQSRPAWKRVFGRMAKVAPATPRVVAAVAQGLPFREGSFAAVVSVYGTPHYLHHTDPNLKGDNEAILAAYTPDVRKQDKQAILASFSDILWVLEPGGKAFLRDSHTGSNQMQDINPYSPTDGSEVVEVLEELRKQGATYEIFEETQPRGVVNRVIVLQKLGGGTPTKKRDAMMAGAH